MDESKKPWPTSMAVLRLGFKSKAAMEVFTELNNNLRTSSGDIEKICELMDKTIEKNEKTKSEPMDGDYVLPELPPKGMRWSKPK